MNDFKSKSKRKTQYDKWYIKFYTNYSSDAYFSGEAAWNACKQKVLKILKKQDGANSISYIIPDIENL